MQYHPIPIDYALSPISTASPSPLDVAQTADLVKVGILQTPPSFSIPCNSLRHVIRISQFLKEEKLYEDVHEASNREHVLGALDRIVKQWVKGVLQVSGYDSAMCEEINAKIFTFGSYRLGVHGPGADIDTLVVSNPNQILALAWATAFH